MEGLIRLVAALISALALAACEGLTSDGAFEVAPDDTIPTTRTTSDERSDPQPTLTIVTSASESSVDRDALVALYNATDGPNWHHSTDWLSDRPLQQWQGVYTDRSGRVTRLILPRNQLRGEIPPEIGDLVMLEELSLPENELRGNIPPEIGNLEQLTLLQLSANDLSDEIPPELGNLANLVRLDLWNNRLTGRIPPQLGSLSNLVKISLAENQLTGGIPPELSNLEHLGYLDLEHNQLTGEIPEDLGNLKRLRLLWLSGNQLTGEVPSELTDRSYFDLGEDDATRCIPQGLRNVGSDSPPSEPDLQAVDRTANTAKLQFHDDPLFDQDRIQQPVTYEVHRSDTGESGPYQIIQSGIPSSEYEDQGLAASTTYYYISKACNGCGCSYDHSDAVGVITEVDGPVDAPATPAGFVGRKVNVDWAPDYALLTWQSSSRATYYQVYQGTPGGDEWQLDAEFSATDTEYRDYAQNTVLIFLDDTTAYTVRACNKAGCSPYSETVTVN